MKLINIEGTSDNACKCGSWLEHWKKFSRQAIPATCPVENCSRAPTVGAHVQKDSSTDKSWYIVPLCDRHNAKIRSLTVRDGIALVSANVSQTCGR